jgi:hypothetical protein
MKSHATLILATVSITSILFGGGCEDSSARQRDQVQTQIHQANVKLKRALGGSGEEAALALQGVVADLSRIDGGEPGQQAAKSLLTATALREVAGIKLAAAESIESAHRLQRRTLHANIDAALQLIDTAAALESVDALAQRQQLQRDIESARAEVAELRARIEQLDGPITERATQNANNKAEVDALRLKVNELRRRAQELGHADGFDTYKEAIDASRQADQIEYEIAQREIDLEHSLTPELTMTDAQAQQLDSLIQSLETARTQLEAFAGATAQEISAIRKQVADYLSLANASINEMDSQRSGDLAAAYDDAQAALEKAASQARSAGSQRSLGQEDVQTARVIGVQAQEALGRSHWAKARGAADHQRLIDRLVSVPGAGADLAQKSSALRDARAQSLEQAKAAYEAAQEQAATVQSRTNPERVEALTRNIETAIASLSGAPTAKSTTAPSTAPPASSTSAPAAPASVDIPVFNSAEELRTYLTSLPKGAQAMRASVAVTHATTPNGQRMLKASTDMNNAFAAIDEAMQKHLNLSFFDAMGPMLETMSPDLSKATVAEETEDRVLYTQTMFGQTHRTVMRKIDGTWKIDVDDLDEKTVANLPMMEQVAASMARGADALVKRIEAGEFKTAQEVMMAFGQLMMPSGPGAPQMPGQPRG